MSNTKPLRIFIATLFCVILLYTSAQVTALENNPEIFQDNTSSPTQSRTATPTITPTPSSHPGIPILDGPADGAVLPQPVAPNEWVFTWAARTGPCSHAISITGPNQTFFSFSAPFNSYHYQTNQFIPDDSLGPWYWRATVICPLGSNSSEKRSFFVEAGPVGVPTWTKVTPYTPTDTITLSPTHSTHAPSETPTFTLTQSVEPSQTLTPILTPTPICPTLPDKPIIIYPNNGAYVSKKSILLDWNDSTCTKFYVVMVRKNTRVGPILVLRSRLLKSQYPITILTNNKKFVWRVAACNRTACAWSEWSKFIVDR